MISVSVSECPSDVTVSVEIVGGEGGGSERLRNIVAMSVCPAYHTMGGNSIKTLPICCPVGHSWWPAV